MNAIHYVKTFSKGQITIPKGVRDFLGLEHEFWLKVYVEQGKIVAEPIEDKKKKISREEYKKKLLSIKGDWFDDEDYKNIRKEINEHFEKNSL